MICQSDFDLTAEIPHLKRFAYSLTRASDRAEDLVQDCLERALRYEHLYKRGTNLRSWLFRMMRNLHINTKRHEKCEQKYLDGEMLKDSHQCAPSQERHLQLGEMKDAFRRLPMTERAALLLVTLKGLSYADAAQKLGCEVGTVKSRVFRARKRLQEMELF